VYPSEFADAINDSDGCSCGPLIEQVLAELERLLGYEQQAEMWATLSKNWAVNDTGIRAGEATNNSKYWAEQAALAAGSVGGGGGDTYITNEVVTDLMYADEGAIAQLVVNHLRTDYMKPWNYLDGDASDIDYMDIHEEQQDFIMASTDGLANEQYSTADGKPIWWLNGVVGGKMTITRARGGPAAPDGYDPDADGPWAENPLFVPVPVMVYVYQPVVKWTNKFGLVSTVNEVGAPVTYKMSHMELGAGDQNGYTKARVYKNQSHLVLEYDHSNGAEKYWLKIGEDGITSYPSLGGGGGIIVVDAAPTNAQLGLYPNGASPLTKWQKLRATAQTEVACNW
jgi:hypothetical protein